MDSFKVVIVTQEPGKMALRTDLAVYKNEAQAKQHADMAVDNTPHASHAEVWVMETGKRIYTARRSDD